MHEFAELKVPLMPTFIIDTFLEDIQKHIENVVNKSERTDFNIFKLNPMEAIKKIDKYIPIFFFSAKYDNLVNVHHTKDLYNQARNTLVK